MATIVGITILVLIVAVIAFIGTRPESFRVERSAQISAPADAIFPLINDFQQWGRWSPYEKLDQNMKRTFEGPSAEPGAVYAWSGNSKAGAGRMTLLESKAGELVSLQLDFFKPFAGTNYANFKLSPVAAGTRITWSMEGKNTLVGKMLSPFMDGMLGKEFEKGLANLNTAAQAGTHRLTHAEQDAPAKVQNGNAASSATS